MPRILEPLLLPRIVQARKSLEHSDGDIDGVDLSASFPTRNSSFSELSLPVTPTFSLRGHSRYASSISSVDAVSPTLRTPASSASPSDALEDSYLGKPSLPDVKEEPHERDESFEILTDRHRQIPVAADEHVAGATSTQSSARPPSPMRSLDDYDLADVFVCESDSSREPSVKRRRGGPSPLTSIATSFGDRFPSLSWRWKGRRLSRPSFALDAAAAAVAGAAVVSSGRSSFMTNSQSSSMASSAVMGPAGSVMVASVPSAVSTTAVAANAVGAATATAICWDVPSPRSPSKSDSLEEHAESALADDTQIAPEQDDEKPSERYAATPLLPPLMVPDTAPVSAPPLQSPLQSPTVAGSPETFSVRGRSPPLSGRPSITSLSAPGAASRVPTSEIPAIHLADQPEDKWSSRLGHANFDIHPEPYLPDVFDAEACRQLRANWKAARCNYIKHLVRTGEHYGDTSKTYRLTEEKWAEIDAAWKANYEQTVAQAEDNGSLTLSLRRASPVPSTVVALPSLNGPRSDGKFPQLGNEDIVGPMVQITSHLKQKPSRRTTLFKFLHDVGWPTGTLRARFGRKITVRTR